MAQIHPVGSFGPGNHQFRATLASRFGKSRMADFVVHPCAHRHLCRAAAPLVSRLSFVFDAGGVCYQPDSWPNFADVIFPVHSDTRRLDIADDGQGSASTQSSSECIDLLASVKRIQSVGSAFLNYRLTNTLKNCSALVVGTVYGETAVVLVVHGPDKVGACNNVPAGQVNTIFEPERVAFKYSGPA
jgi:hypothetical protein